MKRGKIYRYSQRAKLEDLVRIVSENEVSAEGLEEIARDMSRFGNSSVGPLMSALEKTLDENAFYRLTYLIECLQNYSFVEGLLRMLLTRDLPPSLRGQLLNVLNNYDVDISDSLLNVTEGDGRAVTESFVDLTIRDENMLENFLEEFQHLEFDLQMEILNRIASIRSTRSVFILFVLSSMPLSPIARHAANALGRIRDGMALSALIRVEGRTRSGALKREVERSIRRLQLMGVEKGKRFFRFPEGPFYKVFASRIDGLGEFTVSFSRYYDHRKRFLAMSVFQINEECGLTECFGHMKISKRNFDNSVSGLVKARVTVEVPYEYGIRLLRHGMYLSDQDDEMYPPEMALREQVLDGNELYPEKHCSRVQCLDSGKELNNLSLLKRTGSLISIPECSEWLLSTRKTFEYAEAGWGGKEGEIGDMESPRERRLLKGYIRECIRPMRENLRDRLFLAAEMMEQGMRPKKYVRAALCAALNMGEGGSLAFTRHPFVVALAKESLKEAVEYLREGGDYTSFFGEFDDEG